MITPASAQTASPPGQFNARYVWLISGAAALGGLLFGWDWVVMGGAKPFFQPFFHITNSTVQSGWVNSCALIGCLVGSVLAGAFSDRFGRKRLLIASAMMFTVTSIGDGLAQSLVIFVAWRVLGGIAIGLASNLSPMYIAEVAPAPLRGRLVSLNQLTIVVGILLAQFINWRVGRDLPAGASDDFIRSSWFGQAAWRWMFGLTAIPSLLFFAAVLGVPESPRWLAKKGERNQARKILGRIGGDTYASAALRDIETTLVDETAKVNFGELLEPRLFKVLVLGVVLAVFQQWCGINVIFNYAEDIFRAAGYDISAVLKNIAWTGSVNLVFTFVALGAVDRMGRRPLMQFGAAGLAVIYFLMGSCFHFGTKGLPMLALVLAAIACYSMSLAPVTWVVISEIFPNRIRGAAMSVAVAALWIACFILTFTFPLLNQALGAAGTFWLYGGICVVGFLFIQFKLPETKGKSLEQIERELVDAD